MPQAQPTHQLGLFDAVTPRRFLHTARGLTTLREAARACNRCQVATRACQTVFGQGPEDARVVFVGEQPGDEEDLTGTPFVGPAGRVLEDALAQVGINRRRVYVTLAVKHSNWEARGRRRIHRAPQAQDVAACRPWLEAELAAIKPQMLVCLGVTAARALLGASFNMRVEHGRPSASIWAPWTLCTWHPTEHWQSVADGTSPHELAFMEDLRTVAAQLHRLEAA